MLVPKQVDISQGGSADLACAFIESDTLNNALFSLSWDEVVLIAHQIFTFNKTQKLELKKEFNFFQDKYETAINKTVPLSAIQAMLLLINQDAGQ